MYPTVSSVCAFMHYLTLNYGNPSTILNYVASLASAYDFVYDYVYDFILSIKTNIRH